MEFDFCECEVCGKRRVCAQPDMGPGEFANICKPCVVAICESFENAPDLATIRKRFARSDRQRAKQLERYYDRKKGRVWKRS